METKKFDLTQNERDVIVISLTLGLMQLIN